MTAWHSNRRPSTRRSQNGEPRCLRPSGRRRSRRWSPRRSTPHVDARRGRTEHERPRPRCRSPRSTVRQSGTPGRRDCRGLRPNLQERRGDRSTRRCDSRRCRVRHRRAARGGRPRRRGPAHRSRDRSGARRLRGAELLRTEDTIIMIESNLTATDLVEGRIALVLVIGFLGLALVSHVIVGRHVNSATDETIRQFNNRTMNQ